MLLFSATTTSLEGQLARGAGDGRALALRDAGHAAQLRHEAFQDNRIDLGEGQRQVSQFCGRASGSSCGSRPACGHGIVPIFSRGRGLATAAGQSSFQAPPLRRMDMIAMVLRSMIPLWHRRLSEALSAVMVLIGSSDGICVKSSGNEEDDGENK